MYNRYIPQPDGSHCRRTVPEPARPAPKPAPKPAQQPCPPPAPTPCAPPKPMPKPQPRKFSPVKEEPVTGFLRQLLPKDFDTGDLFVVLLLLLMAGDCEEDRNNAILTIALYFMM